MEPKTAQEYFNHFLRYNMDASSASNMMRLLQPDEDVANEAMKLLYDYRGQNPVSENTKQFNPTVDNVMGAIPNAYDTAKDRAMREVLQKNNIVPEQFMMENPDADILHVLRATNPDYVEQRSKAENAVFERDLPGIGPMGAFEFQASDDEPTGILDFLQFSGGGGVANTVSETKRNEYLDRLDSRAVQAFESEYILPQINEEIRKLIPEDFYQNKEAVGELERGLRERLKDEGLMFGMDIDNDGLIGLKGIEEEDTESMIGKSLSELGIGFLELANFAFDWTDEPNGDVEYDEEDITYLNAMVDSGVRKELAKRWRSQYVTNAKTVDEINAKVEAEGASFESFFDYFDVMGDLMASSIVPMAEVGLSAYVTKKAGKRAWNRMATSNNKFIKNHVNMTQMTTTGILATGAQMVHVRENVKDEAWYRNLDPMQQFMYTGIQAAGEVAPALIGASLMTRGAKKLKASAFEAKAESSYLKMVGKVMGTALASLGRGFAEEAITEGVTSAIQYYNDYKYRSLGGDQNAKFDVEEMWNRTLSAAMAGGVMGLAFAGLGSTTGAAVGITKGIAEVKDQKKMDSDPKYREFRQNIETISSDPTLKAAKNEIDQIAKQINNSKSPEEKQELQKRLDEVASNMGVRHSAIIRAYQQLQKENPALHQKLFNVNSLINNLVARYKAIPVDDSPAKIGIEKQLHDAIRRRSELETEGNVQQKVADQINGKLNEVNTKIGRFRMKQGYAPQSMTIDAQVDETIRAAEVERALNSLSTNTKEQMKEMYGVMRKTFDLPAEKAYHAAEVANRMIGNMAKRSGMSFEATRALIVFRKGDKGMEAGLKKGGKALFQNNYLDRRTGLRYEYDKNSKRFEQLKAEGRITEDKTLADFEGEFMWVHGPDDAGTMNIYVGNDLVYEGKGGAYYPMKFADQNAFWASRGKTLAENAAKTLNEAARKSKSGNALMSLMTGNKDKILNSSLGYRGAVELLIGLAKKRRGLGMTTSMIKDAMIKTLAKDNKADGISERSSLEEVKQRFYESYDDMSFDDRAKMFHSNDNTFLGELARMLKKLPKEQQLAIKEVIKNPYSKGGSEASRTSLVDGLTYMLAEPHVRDLYREYPTGSFAYAVVEAVRPEGMSKDEDLVYAEESDLHESYPYMLKVKPGVQVKIHFLQEHVEYNDSFMDPETGLTQGFELSESGKPKSYFGGQIQASTMPLQVKTEHSREGEIEWLETPIQSMRESGISQRNEIVQQAANDLYEGKITNEDYQRIVAENTPIDQIIKFYKAVDEDHAREALGAKADKMLQPFIEEKPVEERKNKKVPEMRKVGLRLDIPAYLNKNAWVVSAHDGEVANGKVVSYLPAARLSNVEFVTDPNIAINIAKGKAKSTFARMVGTPIEIEGDTWNEMGENGQKLIEEIIDSPNWTQIGMNPFRHSFFWDRVTKAPVVKAEEVIQVGGNVYAKNVQYAAKTDNRFKVRDPKVKPVVQQKVNAEGKPVFKDGKPVMETIYTYLKDADGKDMLFQDSKGAMVAEDSRFIIYSLTDPDVSTPLHELAHVFEHYLTPEERARVMAWAGHDTWTRETSEAFARGFEKFLSEKADDVTLSPGMKKLFGNFREWLLDIYKGITGSDIDLELNAPMRTLYGKMIEPTREQERRNFKMQRTAPNNKVADDDSNAKQIKELDRTKMEMLGITLDRLFGDRYREVKELVKEIEQKLPRALRFSSREQLFYGRSAARLEDAKAEMFEPFHRKRSEAGVSLDMLSEFLHALHANERNAMVFERSNGEVENGSGMSSQEAQEVFGKYNERQLQVLRDLANDVYEMIAEIRNLQVEYGLESQETIDAYENMFQFYVPLRGFADADYEQQTDAGVKLPSGTGFSVRGSGNLKIGGRTTKAANILLQVERMHAATLLAGERNTVINSLYDLAANNPDPSVWTLTNQRPEGKMMDHAVEIRREGQRSYIVFADRRYADQLNNAPGKKLQAFMDVLEATKIRSLNNFLRSSFTTLSPAFVFVNYFRDAGAVIFNSAAESSIPDGLAVKDFKWKIISQSPLYIKNLYTLFRGGEVNPEFKAFYEEYRSSGGRTGWAYNQSIEELAKSLETSDNKALAGAKWARENILGYVEDVNASVEDSFRMAAFVEARKAGQDIESAALLAKNITVNFNQSGELGPLLNTLFLFFGSSVQGTKRFMRSMFTLKSTKKPKGVLDAWHNNLNTAQKFAVFSMNLGAVITAMNYAISDEEEDGILYYDKIADFEKERNIIIMVGPKKHVSIPLPYGYNIFHQLGTMFVEIANGGRTTMNASVFLGSSFINSFVPFSFGNIDSASDLAKSFTPTAFRGAADVFTNETYFGSPVFQKNLPFGPPKPNSELSFRGPDWWRETFKFINKATGGSEYVSGGVDINPDGLMYMVNYYIGGLGRFVSRTGNLISNVAQADFDVSKIHMDANEMPILRNFMGGANKYYDFDRYEEFSKIVEQMGKELESGNLTEDKERYKGIPQLVQYNKNVNKKRRMIWEAKNEAKKIEDYAEREDRLFELSEMERELIANFNMQYEKLRGEN